MRTSDHWERPTQSAVQAFLNQAEGPATVHRVGLQLLEQPEIPVEPRAGSRRTPSTARSSARTSRPTSPARRSATCTRTTSSARTWSRASTWRFPPRRWSHRQTYDAATLAGPLSNQMAALKAAGCAGRGAWPPSPPPPPWPCCRPRSSATRRSTWSTASAPTPRRSDRSSRPSPRRAAERRPQARRGRWLAQQRHHRRRTSRRSRTPTNAWVQQEKKLLEKYAPSLYAKSGLDGNTQYGIALAYTFVQALQKAGQESDRGDSLMAADQRPTGKKFVTPGFVPLSYSSSVALRLRGRGGPQARGARPPPAVTPTGSWIGGVPVHSCRGDQRRNRTDQEVHRSDLDATQEPVLDVLRPRPDRRRGATPAVGGRSPVHAGVLLHRHPSGYYTGA